MHHTGFDVKLFTSVFVTLVVIMDPIGTIPLFLALTSGRSGRARRRLAWQAVLVAISVIAAFALFGQQILRYLALRFANVVLCVIREGGVLLVTRFSGLLLSAIAVQLIATSAIAFARTA